MSYGRIRRGPMAADAFTQIRNAVFRDARLSAKAMGIFGNISTHRDGWGITPESLSTQMKDGVGAIKAGLRELEDVGYLKRTRNRNKDGTLGASVYFITDQPEAFEDGPELDNPRSAPEVENPPVDKPAVDQPPVEDRPHKKTNSQHISSKKTLSPRLPQQTVEQPPAAPEGERETIADAAKTATRLTAAQKAVRGIVTADEADAFIAWVIAECKVRLPAWWRTAADDLPELADTWRAKQNANRAAATRPTQAPPPWCQHLDCDETTRRRTTEDTDGHRSSSPCPACHPDRYEAQAA